MLRMYMVRFFYLDTCLSCYHVAASGHASDAGVVPPCAYTHSL